MSAYRSATTTGLGVVLLLSCGFALADVYRLNWYTVDAGGGVSTDDASRLRLHGTIGQPDAGDTAGGPYVMRGGFWVLPTRVFSQCDGQSISESDFRYDGLNIIVDGCTLNINGAHHFRSLRVRNSGTLTHPAGARDGMQLTIDGDVTVESGSRIDVKSCGYGPGSGPGQGETHFMAAGGGGHGGDGGRGLRSFPGPHPMEMYMGLGGSAYDSFETPTAPSSGGGSRVDPGYYNYPGGPGGGAIRLSAGGTVCVNGLIDASGADASDNPGTGGGAGGSIYLVATHFAGSGFVVANGGRGTTYFSLLSRIRG